MFTRGSVRPKRLARRGGGASARRALPLRSASLLLSLPLLLGAAAPASAYVRTLTAATAVPVSWPSPELTVRLAQPPDWFRVPTAQVRDAAEAALAAWSAPAIGCTAVALRLAPGIDVSQAAGRDRVNRIVVRAGAWCRDPDALTNCHDHSQVALTTLFLRNHPGSVDDGDILEADIELNAVDYDFAAVPDGPVSARDYLDRFDVGSILTHEVGHLIGVAHDCTLPGDDATFDDRGLPVPECFGASSAVQEATMYAISTPTDVGPRTLTADETRAACEIYPAGALEGVVSCAVAAPPASGGRARPGARVSAARAALTVGAAAFALAYATGRGRARGRARRRRRG